VAIERRETVGERNDGELVPTSVPSPGSTPRHPARRHLYVVREGPPPSQNTHAAPAPAVATMLAEADPDGAFSALHFIPCVVCGRELVRLVHGFATERAAGLFIVEQGWLEFAVYETRWLPEVLRE
jgi:hypothetical protein